MNKPKVSIVVPIYGVEKYLHQCVDSILAQTLKDIEIILVDDGSKDRCPEIVDEYAKKDKRVKVIHKENSGYGDFINIVITYSLKPLLRKYFHSKIQKIKDIKLLPCLV